jgi:phospholipase/carboxylesterase
MVKAGIALDKANKVAIMIHGRGATAESIMSLKNHLNLDDFALIAPQASGNTWYPYSFMAPDATNEPAFSNAIRTVDEIVKDLESKGFSSDQIYLIGFSQGACLSLEYATQNAKKYGGVVAFTGGLIGEKIHPDKYKGDFKGTKIFIGSSHKDMHVPLSRIEDSADLIKEMEGNIETLIFKDSEHTIRKEEVDWVNENILKK